MRKLPENHGRSARRLFDPNKTLTTRQYPSDGFVTVMRHSCTNRSYIMRTTLAALAFLFNVNLVCADTISVNGFEREYILDVGQRTKNAPLIVALHGGLGTAQQIRRTIGLSAIANAKGITVVYPNGIDKGWNDGRRNRRGQLVRDTADVAFIEALVKHLIAKGLADPNRVVFTGISNGGTMSFKMACDSSLKIAGIVPVVANIPEPLDCSRARTKLINIISTDDRLMPMAGGRIRKGAVKSSAETFQTFLKANDCTGTTTKNLADTVDDGMQSTMQSGTGCSSGRVSQIIVQGGGHAWPGSPGQIEFITGKPTMDFSASQLVVDFTLGLKE
jgi:polyhydroxybutyrate depolymerase